MTCPPPHTLDELAAGLLAEEDAAAVKAHIAVCVTCTKNSVTGDQTGVVDPRAFRSSNATGLAATLNRGSTLGRYTVLEKLGEGGMGVVFAAFDSELNRKVALKLLSSAHDPEARARLLREAQSMAKLAHPNVLAIHDVTTTGEDVVMVMEFVDGGTLRDWRMRERPGWRDALCVLLAAGEGLAAAHAGGLIHRDFKPDNILVGKDGRIRVADFGIARVLETSQDAEPPGPGPRPAVSSELGSGTSLTRVGLVIGTPAYMAPEQFSGTPASPSSDQYSFGVTLYEALTGTRPFAGLDGASRLRAAQSEQYQPTSTTDGPPAWLLRTVKRALAPDPASRFASMPELLAALRRDPSVLRRRVAAVVMGLLLTVAGCGYVLRQRSAQARACRAVTQTLTGVWDAAAREHIKTSFARTGLSFAPNSLRLVERILDAQAKAWSEMSVASCEATHVRHEQTVTVFALRERCLTARYAQLRALSATFQKADAEVVQRAAQIAEGVAPVRVCADISALRAQPPLPADPAIRAKVQALEGRLAEARVAIDSGSYSTTEKALKTMVTEARSLGDLTDFAIATQLLSDIHRRGGNTGLASDEEAQALTAALEVGDDTLAATAAFGIASDLMESLQMKKAHEWTGYAMALVHRSGASVLEARILMTLAGIEAKEGHVSASLDASGKAAAILELNSGPRTLFSMAVHYNRLSHAFDLGRYRETYDGLRSLILEATELLGGSHPFIIFCLEQQVEAAVELGQLEEAHRLYDQLNGILDADADGPGRSTFRFILGDAGQWVGAGELQRGNAAAALGWVERAAPLLVEPPSGAKQTASRATLAQAYLALGQRTEARRVLIENERATHGMDRILATGDAEILVAAGELLLQAGELQKARLQFEAALKLRTGLCAADHPLVSWARAEVARADVEAGDFASGLSRSREALTVLEPALGAENPELAGVVLTQARAEVGMHRCAQAQVLLERAQSMLEARPGRNDLRARASYTLARCLEGQPAQTARVEALAVDAQRALVRVAASVLPERKSMEVWLKGRGL